MMATPRRTPRASSRPARGVALLGLVAVAGLYVGMTLPPRAIAVPGGAPTTIAYGAYHVHTTRSDGTGSPDEVAQAAARAGLQYVVLTDHGDGTRPPDPPAYLHGVLVFDAVEITTSGGHVVALDLRAPAPYPLAGEPRDVIEDIHRLGGRAIVAHPDSSRARLSWQAWTTAFDGIEWLNADSEWRDDGWTRIAGAAARALIRGPESIVTLFDRPERTLARWDHDTAAREVLAVGAVDAHARSPWSADEPRRRSVVSVPSYETMFRTVVQGVLLDRPLSGRAGEDAARLMTALLGGRTFTAIPAVATPATAAFTAERGDRRWSMGDRLDDTTGALTFHASATLAGARIVLLHGGRALASGPSPLSHTAPSPDAGAYRIEIFADGHPVPWIATNPIYVGARTSPAPGAPPPAEPAIAGDAPPLAGPWRIERDASSVAELTHDDGRLTLAFTLGGGPPAGQYAAVVTNVDDPRAFTQVELTGRADRPTRVSLQVRLPGDESQRWQRSIYLDTSARTMTVPIAEFLPAGPATQRPDATLVRGVLIVVDTVNHPPGSQGRIDLLRIALR